MNRKLEMIKAAFFATAFMFLILSSTGMAYTNSTISCVDNLTLQEVISVDVVNSSNILQILNSSAYVLTTPCDYGCDNITSACILPPYQQDLVLFGFIMAFVIVMAFILRHRR
jgi:hypothetical protein